MDRDSFEGGENSEQMEIDFEEQPKVDEEMIEDGLQADEKIGSRD
jgi:hypothetical protein